MCKIYLSIDLLLSSYYRIFRNVTSVDMDVVDFALIILTLKNVMATYMTFLPDSHIMAFADVFLARLPLFRYVL